MFIYLAPQSRNLPDSAPWHKYDVQMLHSYISKEMPLAMPEDNSILFIGETHPDIATASAAGKEFGVIALTPDPFYYMPLHVLKKITTLYVLNQHHLAAAIQSINDRHGPSNENFKFDIRIWPFYPKPFEPMKRTKPLIGIAIESANNNLIGEIMQSADLLKPQACDLIFFTYTQEIFAHMTQSSGLNVCYLNGDDSPWNMLQNMPNAVVSLDQLPFSALFNAWAQVIPVIRPSFVDSMDPSSYINGSPRFHQTFFEGFVNNLRTIEELSKSNKFSDLLHQATLVGDLYGDYSKIRAIYSSR